MNLLLAGSGSFPEDFFHVSDFRTDLARHFFNPAFEFELRIVSDLARLLFESALHFLQFALECIFSALFQLVLSFLQLAGNAKSTLTAKRATLMDPREPLVETRIRRCALFRHAAGVRRSVP